MYKWSQIKEATLNKLFLTSDEADNQGYLNKFLYLANECLSDIANTIKPKVKVLTITIVDDDTTIEDTDVNTYHADDVITMPYDFLSFSDFTNTLTYIDDYDEEILEEDPIITYLTDTTISLPETGEYKIYYNALYADITDTEVTNDTRIDVPQSLLNCIPSYIASQLLSQDDIQRSTILRNEYELMLTRLDTDTVFPVKHFKGWI